MVGVSVGPEGWIVGVDSSDDSELEAPEEEESEEEEDESEEESSQGVGAMVGFRVRLGESVLRLVGFCVGLALGAVIVGDCDGLL
jgi:hypothetical protein